MYTHTHTHTQCNNPMTKEPKLKSAVRIVPEWTDYDLEIKALWEKHFGATPTTGEPPLTTKQSRDESTTDDHPSTHSEL